MQLKGEMHAFTQKKQLSYRLSPPYIHLAIVVRFFLWKKRTVRSGEKLPREYTAMQFPPTMPLLGLAREHSTLIVSQENLSCPCECNFYSFFFFHFFPLLCSNVIMNKNSIHCAKRTYHRFPRGDIVQECSTKERNQCFHAGTTS